MPTGAQAAAAAIPGAAESHAGDQKVVAVAAARRRGQVHHFRQLACALKYLGATVGLLDCDIYGPSIPLMMAHMKNPRSPRTRR